MTIRHAALALGVIAGATLALAADPPTAPAPPTPAETAMAGAASFARGAGRANVVPQPFRAQLVVDNRYKQKVKNIDGTEGTDPRNRTGTIHCLVCENGLSPVVAIFVRADLKGLDETSGLGKLIKGTDTLIPKYRSDKMAAFAMFLKLEGGPKPVALPGGDPDKPVIAAKEYPDDENRDLYVTELKDFAKVVVADNVPFGLAPKISPYVTAFGVAGDVPVTVLIYNRLRMVQRWELKLDEVTNEKISEILNATEEMIRGKVK
jgi:hypothetical protein